MARKSEQPANGGNNKGKVKAFVFGFELEGNEEVLAEGIKAFTTAISRSGISVSQPVLIKANNAAPQLGPATAEQEETTLLESVPNDGDEDGEEKEDTPGKSPSGSGGAKRQASFRKLEFLNELDLNKATKSLADFMTEKGSPKSLGDKYIAVAAWLKDHMQIESFTIDHIYTAFDNLGWKAQIPTDHSSPLRDLKSKRHFLTYEKGAGYKLNWQGIQYVEKMGTVSS